MMDKKKLQSGSVVPVTIRTDERIFEVLTYDYEYVLCNLNIAYMLLERQECMGIKHYWDNKFKPIGKDEVIIMFKNQSPIK